MPKKYINCDFCDCTESEWRDEDSEAHYYRCYQCGATTNVWKDGEMEIGDYELMSVDTSIVNDFKAEVNINYKDEEGDWQEFGMLIYFEIEEEWNGKKYLEIQDWKPMFDFFENMSKKEIKDLESKIIYHDDHSWDDITEMIDNYLKENKK